MNENESKKQNWLPIIGGIILIIVLFILIKLIFAGLEKTLPQQPVEDVSSSASQSVVTDTRAPHFCPFCGEELNDSFQWGQYCPFCGEKVEE